MDRPIEFIEILKYLTEEDETSLILKSHLHVEREIEFLIKKAFIRPEYLKKLSFAEKIKVLCSLNIIDISMYNDIARFNAIRNAFSHKYKYKLANDDLSFLRKVLGEEVSDITKNTK